MVTSVTFEGRPAVLGYIMNIERQKKLQEQLALEKARAEALIENAPLLVVGLGVRSKILLFNRYAEKVTGYRSEEVLGKEWIELFIAEELREEVYEVWKQVVQRKAVVHEYENPIVTKDGSRRIIKWYNKVITEGSEFWISQPGLAHLKRSKDCGTEPGCSRDLQIGRRAMVLGWDMECQVSSRGAETLLQGNGPPYARD